MGDLRERHWWWRAREALVLEELDRLRPGGAWNRVLDVGCGGGVLFDALLERARHVEGIEPDADLVDPESPHSPRIHLRRFDPTFRPPGGPYDLILVLDVLAQMDRRIEALAHAGRLLGSTGVLVVTVPALPLLWTGHDELSEHRLRYTRTTLAAEIRLAGLRVRTLRYFFHWTVMGKLLQRAMEGVLGREASPPRVPLFPVNHLLEGLSRLEHMVGRRLRLPFGSSLLLVAEPGAGKRALSPSS